MLANFGRTLVLLTILALPLAASAQHPLAGTWQETQIGFVVTFEQQPGGQLKGTLQGAGNPMPLNIVTDLRSVQGTFLLEGQTSGFAAELQSDDRTLLIWLFEVDAAGQPLQGSAEQYLAYRKQLYAPGGGPPSPPTGGIPAVPSTEPRPNQGDITGSWRSDGQFDDGTPFVAELKFDVSGSWQLNIVVEGQPFAYFGGPYTFSPDGVLRYQETSRSPQVCFRGQCQDNSLPDSSGNEQVYFQDADTIVTMDAQSGEQTVYRRSASVGGMPQSPGPGVPNMTPPMAPPPAGGFPPMAPPAAGGFPPMAPPAAGGFPPMAPPAAGGFPPVPPAAGGFPPVPPAAGGFPPMAPPPAGGFPPMAPPAAGGPTAPVSASDLVGVWEAEQKMDASLTLTVITTFGANGSWRHDFSEQGKPVAFYEGTFTVSPQGVVQLQVANNSPQMCVRGTCQPAKATDIIRTFQVIVPAPDALTTVGRNSAGGEVRLAYRRVGRSGM